MERAMTNDPRRWTPTLDDSPSLIGSPRASEPIKDDSFTDMSNTKNGCPNCGCNKVMRIEVDLDRGENGQALGIYTGCPACPWASSMNIYEFSHAVE